MSKGETLRRMAPAIVVLNTGSTHAARLLSAWRSDDPLLVELTIEVAHHTRMSTPGEFPDGLRCSKCLLVIDVGQFYAAVPVVENEIDQLECTGCGFDCEETIERATWEISAELIASMLGATSGAISPPAAVRMQRINPGNLRFWFTEDDNTMSLDTPINPMLRLFQEIKAYARVQPDGRLDTEYLDEGLGALERLANGEL